MKKLISVFFAILMVMAVMVPAFAAFGDYANKSYKVCANEDKKWGPVGCPAFNDIDATVCHRCGDTLDESRCHVFSTGDHDLPLDENGHEEGGAYVRCPECDWVNTYIPTDKDGVCRYCDATIPNWLDLRFEVEYAKTCPNCSKTTIDDVNYCQGCGQSLMEVERDYYSDDPLDPNANMDVLDELLNKKENDSFFTKLAKSFSNFFAKIAEFFKMIGNAIGSIFK